MLFPKMALQTGMMSKHVRFIESTKFIVDSKFFNNVRTVRLQRQVTEEQTAYFSKFLKVCADALGFWLIYEIDDVVIHDDMPDYNLAKTSYPTSFGANINSMLAAADFITVTTDELAKYYSNKCAIPMDKIIVVPNYIPKWWSGNVYIEERKSNYDNMKNKPRILFSGAISHIDINNKCGYDDYSHLVNFIKSTTKKYDWTFLGAVPNELHDDVRAGKINVVRGFDFLNYLQGISSLQPHAIVAPLKDSLFNSCKSNIKQIEGWATGIPVFAQNIAAYNKWGNKDMLFKTADELQNGFDKLFKSRKTYIEDIKINLNEMNHGGPNNTGWWLENNLDMWLKLSTMPQKTLRYDVREESRRV